MKVLFDTNIVLDVLLDRTPWVRESSALWQANDAGQVVGYVTASAFTDVFYIARRLAGKQAARAAIRILLEAFAVCPVHREALELAESLEGEDFEDNLQAACAELMGLDAIATRNKSDFIGSAVPPFTPAEILQQLTEETQVD